jgi:hypothetical protein
MDTENVHIYEYHSATKENETLSPAAAWRESEDIILIEINQAQKDNPCIFSVMWEL